MYYVKRRNNNFFVARGPKFNESAWVGNIPELELLYYDYDDLDHWNDVYLAKEARIVGDENSDEYDPAAVAAVRGETQRRAGKESPPWFDSLDDLIKALNNAAEEDDDHERKPIVLPEMIDPDTRRVIRKLAKIEKERWEEKEPSTDAMFKLESKLMKSSFAHMVRDGVDYVEDEKMVAAHLLFLYTQERQIALLEGRKPDEDFLLAGSCLYNIASLVQMIEEE